MTRFPPQVPMPFSREVVDDIDDGQIGCYGLFAGPRALECVYIGKGELRARMLGHLDGDNACIAAHTPTHWIGVVSQDSGPLHAELVAEYRPTCNRKQAAPHLRDARPDSSPA